MTVKIEDKDRMTNEEKHKVWAERYKVIEQKPVSRKRTEKELIDDDRIWGG